MSVVRGDDDNIGFISTILRLQYNGYTYGVCAGQ